MKTKLFTAGLLLTVSNAWALSPELVNQALNRTLNEQARVESNYKENLDTEDKEHIRGKNDRVEVVMDGEISHSSRLKDYDNPDRTYREKHIQAKLDREVKEVNKDVVKEEQAIAKREEAELEVTASRSKPTNDRASHQKENK